MAATRTRDEVTRAVLARAEVARLIEHGEDPPRLREQVLACLRELYTTQRYALYRTLPTLLYPVLRKIPRLSEHAQIARGATKSGRVIYASNHRSHFDYLVQPIVLEDNGVRPPLIAAGFNLFGGPLGLLHRHVTGAIPIRRATRDPVYLTALKAYVAERLKDHDLFVYPEGGRSYSGELKPYKTGLLHAAMQAGIKDLLIVPVAISYDLVLEDRVLAGQGVKRRQRPFTHEIAEMAKLGVGYRSRSFTVFGQPVSVSSYDPESRTDALELAKVLREATGKLVKVLPTALVAHAMQRSVSTGQLESRIATRLEHLLEAGANLAARSVKDVMEDGVYRLEHRGVIQTEQGTIRVRDRRVLRYYARSIQHLLPAAP
jgi:glycerol-3-phosphate O-acyltransferase